MRLFVLAHRGMLGHVVARYFRENGFEVAVTDRRFEAGKAEEFLEEVKAADVTWCINCVGIGPNRGGSETQMREANRDLPLACVGLLQAGIRLIHASTDAVFKPDRPSRTSDEPPDANDEYGVQKKSAEAALVSSGANVIRCSIIGPEAGAPRNLLQWVLNQQGAIPGYVNQMWNGITTLEWAKLAMEIVKGRILFPIVQPGFLPPISKFQLVHLIAEIWQIPHEVIEAHAKLAITRSLVPNIQGPALRDQLNELRQWY